MKETIGSPLAIKLLLHFHCCPEPYPDPSEASAEVGETLLATGAIRPREDPASPYHPGQSYETTDLGKAWVEMLCATPVPIVRYIDPRTNRPIECVL